MSIRIVSDKVRKNLRKMVLSMPVLIGAMSSSASFALDCKQVRLLTNYYFKMHFTYTEFNDELSKRSLDLFIKAWDPGKLYFLQSDIDRFEKQYMTSIDNAVLAADCSFIDDIVSTYSQRFTERQKGIDEAIAAKQDFTVDEYLEVDQKKMPWAKTGDEIADRWRKRVKFQIMGIRETLTDEARIRTKMEKRMAIVRKRHKATSSDEVMGIYLNAFASALDPHTDYMGPDELEDFRINTRLSLEGIGAVLRSDDGFTTIQSLVAGGAAAQSGLIKKDDKIIAVAQGNKAAVDVVDMDLKEVVKLIRGPHDTEVKLTITRDEKGKNIQRIVPLRRKKVQLTDKAAKSQIKIVKVGEGASATNIKVGVITLLSFYMDFEGRQNKEANYKSSSADMLREIEAVKKAGAQAVILDLRNNGGGSLDEAVTISGLFIKSGPMVQIRASDGSNTLLEDKDSGVAWDGPLAVMINRQSASASEIFAGAIQDYKRGLIIGDTHTFGKGTVQNLNDVSDKLGAIKVTISKFYRPSGSSTQLRGVESDIVIPDIFDELEIGEKFYDYALPWEKIKDSEFKKLAEVEPYIKKLSEASASRLQTDKSFKQVAEDIKQYKDKILERTRYSLKEKSAAEKAAEKVKLESRIGFRQDVDPETVDENTEVLLIDDFLLQEGLRIAADYVALKAGQGLQVATIPEVEAAEKSRVLKNKAEKNKAEKNKPKK
jgi:carboxyl-terminal processing protease